MKTHWSMFREGGTHGNAETGRPCHRCDCKKGEIMDVFATHVARPTDNVKSLATEFGILPHELKLINNLNKDEEATFKALHHPGNSKLEDLSFRVRAHLPFICHCV
eukprot:TRINITY_DN888_c0_g5_i1.p1 TRINITY_DN888_c0_g5~~TRINITY_DN888_c0_g5_i1.p1  ORF type:complete len:106 (+),score=14.96 TRINITY_DN888_c0_g5_i1:264-581(+)